MKIFSKDNRMSIPCFIILGIIYVIATGFFINLSLGSLDDAYYGLTEISDSSFVEILKQLGICFGLLFLLGIFIIFIDAKVRTRFVDIVNILMQLIFIGASIYGIYMILLKGHNILINTPDSYTSFYHVAIEYLCVPLFFNIVGVGISRYYKKYIGVVILGVAGIVNLVMYLNGGALYTTAILLGLSFIYSLCIKN